ncbi:MAG: hypothetical protein QOD26_2731 [Betaproteobacteria bacterium]|nr:hypothetical protein [Betaproteobacteria bacterium]
MMPAAHAADAFAPIGAKATLTVDYVYESTGKKRSEGMYDPYEWRVRRSVNLVADLAAQPSSALPTLQAADASQMAALKDKTRKAQAVQAQMEPMMADVQKIMAKCGEDEACLTRESQKMGAAMRGTPKMDAAMNAKKDMQALGTPDAPRYQAWRATAQTGSYLIDETVHVSVPDPLCAKRPRQRCTRDEVRKGSGDLSLPREAKKNRVAATGISAVEVDTGKNTLTLRLPAPLLPLPYTETITTDEPSRSEDPKGPQKKQHSFRAGVAYDKPLTVALKGGWRSQAGEQVVPLKGEFGEAGNLTVRWRFNVQ